MTAMWQKAARAARARGGVRGMSRRRRCRAGCGAGPHQGNWWTTGVSAAPPHQFQQQNRLMLGAGVDMIGVMLSSPYTAERDVAGIASSQLAGT